MRITQSSMMRNYLKNLGRASNDVARSSQRMTSGRKFTKLSENVSDGTRALKVREQLDKDEQYLTNIRDAESELASAESNMMSVNEILQTVQSKLKEAMTGTAEGTKREIIALEIGKLKDQVLQFSNAQFADNYLFSGTNNAGSPFDKGADGRMTYNGIPVDQITKNPADGKYYTDNTFTNLIPNDEEKYIDMGMGLSMSGGKVDPKSAFKTSFSGLDIFGAGTDANGNSGNLYNLLSDIETSLKNYGDGEQVKDLSTKLTEQTDMLMTNITDIGTRSAFLAKTTERIENDIEKLTELGVKLEVTDDPKETVSMKMYDYAWKATLQLGAKIIPLSLMDFIR